MRSIFIGSVAAAMVLYSSPKNVKAETRDLVIIGAAGGALALIGAVVVKALSNKTPASSGNANPLPNYPIGPETQDVILLRKAGTIQLDPQLHRSIRTQSRYSFESHMARLKENATGVLDAEIIEALEKQQAYRYEKSLLLDAGLLAHYGFVASPTRVHPITSTLLNPMLANEEGLFSEQGHRAVLGFSGRGGKGRWFSYEFEPLLKYSAFETIYQKRVQPFIKRALLKATIGGLELEAGKDVVSWGIGRYSSMLFSNNQESLPLLRLGNTLPVRMPWFLNALGPTRADAFMAILNSNRVFPKSMIMGSKLAFLPHKRVEFAFGQFMQFGGEGTTTAQKSPLNYFGESVGKGNPNRGFSFDLKYRIPKIEWEPYTELYYEDCCIGFPTNKHAMGTLFGLFIPRLDSEGRWDLAIEMVSTYFVTYRHKGIYLSGLGYRGHNMGHPLGPDSDAYYAITRYFFSGNTFAKFVFAFEENLYEKGEFVEARTRGQGGLSHQASEKLQIGTDLAVERMISFANVGGDVRHNFKFGMTLTYR